MNTNRSYNALSWVKYLLKNATCVGASYGRRKKQVGKEDMYMMTALWMEQSPWNFKYPGNKMNFVGEEKTLNVVGEEKTLNVVGSVFVLPNDRVLSVDCSRRNKEIKIDGDEGILHGAVQALIKYPDRVKDCKVYLSRKPCAHCVKMLVQAAVEKVFYLPLRPEKDDKEENESVDALFQVSTASKSFFVPWIKEHDMKELEESKNPYGSRIENLGAEGKKYAEKEWEKWQPQIKEKLFWKEFEGEGIKAQVDEDMKRMFEWFGVATFATGHQKNMNWKFVKGEKAKKGGFSPEKDFSLEKEKEVASHLSRLAQMLSNRTDDPNRGVGCVIAVDDEIISIGWNGFPSKALYGNHPRGSRKEDEAKPKYPHVIHAEQNALLSRNRRDLTNSVVYVNKIPCNECMPMLYQSGVKDVVVPSVDREKINGEKKTEDEKGEKDTESFFYKLLNEGEISVYEQAPQNIT